MKTTQPAAQAATTQSEDPSMTLDEAVEHFKALADAYARVYRSHRRGKEAKHWPLIRTREDWESDLESYMRQLRKGWIKR